MTDARIDMLKEHIRDIPDFPKEGILFKDITPLLAHPKAFTTSLALIEERFQDIEPNVVVGMESRGFIFGAALAAQIGIPFVPARKPGKLPYKHVSVEYELEYGTDRLEMHEDALSSDSRVLIVDDLIATGGTAWATGELVRKVGGTVAGYAFVIELAFLKGRERLGDVPVESLCIY
ncbi:MAG: adenine phosphoribosyltransferase [Myxococcota bacterium]